MVAIPAIPGMHYPAFPPEVNTGRLMAGAGAAPMLQAAAGWEALAIALETQAIELAGNLASLSGTWSGAASERAVSATTPMVMWLQTTAMQAQKRALQAIAQANSYVTAMATTPQLPEIEMNHVTHGVLEATNFLGINTMPIGFNEMDYARMWALAGTVMETYSAETSLNTIFEAIEPMQPIVMPGVGESTAAAALAQAATMMPEAAARNLIMGQVSGQSVMEEAALWGGNAASQFNYAAQRAEGQAQRSQTAAQQQQPQDGAQQGSQMLMQVVSQVGSQAAQIPQQLGQLITQPVQQLSQPMQQMTQIFSQLGSSFGQSNGPQMGFMGASPFTNHPAAGGSGAATGAGLVRAASLPGMGGTTARTPLMASLVGGPEGASAATALAEEGAGAAAGASAAGKAPMSGPGGALGMKPKNEKDVGTKEALKAPGALVQDLDDEDDDW
ncbi:PPE family protein [Mycobacterium sp. OTB74]|uniref:PPE family protein n=1 Tax=Mycobacterium sp. OTB74 TaxID=1853452 RepID=UPI002473DF91|nr:PPE family protein [Mycobacterium sp. OTB74]MDH6244332.1 PPE-repeat protein [Mycobacterium sp. OTB74]